VIAIIGAGIAGLAAAFFLRDEPVRTVVLEGARQTGGKLSLAEVAGCQVDVGAEALLARRPEGTGLVRAAGLGDGLRSPGTTTARIWSRGTMHRLPARQYMGVPADVGELGPAGLLSAGGLERAAREPGLAPTHRDGDVSVQGYVAARFGQEVVDRLVDPLLGGVYAGRSEELSFEATLPGLARAAQTHASLASAAASLLPPVPASPAQAYQATFTTQDSSGTKYASPKIRPTRKEPRRLRCQRATASRAGPTTARGQMPSGGKAAARPRPPARATSRACQVRRPSRSTDRAPPWASPRAASASPASGWLARSTLPRQHDFPPRWANIQANIQLWRA